MTRPDRPPAVLRFLHRPLWWALGVAVFVALELGAQAREVTADNATFAASAVVPATLVDAEAPDGLLDVAYTPPDHGAPVRSAVMVQGVYDGPTSGEIPVEVSSSDPRAVRLPEAPKGFLDDVPFFGVALALPLGSWALRRRHVRRIESLVRSPDVAYAMLGAVAPPARLQRRWRLFLYSVDAKPGADPVCAVELVWLPARPLGAFPVEVKGSPRPFGTVAVRAAADDVLWPRGRALGARATMPRPGSEAPFPPPRPVELSGLVRPPSLWPFRLLRIAGLAVLAGVLWLNHLAHWDQERLLERSLPAAATAASQPFATGAGHAALVEYPDASGATVKATVAVGDLPVAIGDPVAVRYDVTAPSAAWLASGPGPPATGAEDWMVLGLFLGPALLVVAGVVRRQTLVRLGAYELTATGRLVLGAPPGEPQ